jgi:hypothetical protein
MGKHKLRPRKGAIGLMLVRFIHPPQPFDDKNARCQVVLINRFFNEKQKACFHVKYDGDDDGQTLQASARYVKILKEGPASDLFDPPTAASAVDPSLEPKIKWKKYVARSILYNDVRNGIVPLTATGMKLNKVYAMHREYSEYSYRKFSSRLSSIRKTIAHKERRSESDKKALAIYVKNHPVSHFS